MIPPLPEADLLAFIEGELPTERLPEVQSALRADPELRRLVESLRADRGLIRASLDRAAASAPGAIAREAIAEAERLPAAKPAPAAPAQPAPRLRIAPLLSLVAAAAVVVLALVVFWPAPPSSDRFAAAPAGPPAPGEPIAGDNHRKDFAFDLPQKASPGAAPPVLPDVLRGGGDGPLDFKSATPPPAAPTSIRTAEQAERDRARDEQIRRVFGLTPEGPADFESQLADAGREGWRPGIEVGGMDLGRAAQLAMTRRLRIVVESPNAQAIRGGAGFMTIERLSDPSLASRQGNDQSPSEAISVTFPLDPEMEGLQNALARIAESIESQGDSVVRFEEVPEDQGFAEAARVVPSTDADDVVWWRLPSDRWLISSSVTVPIEFVEPENAGP